MVSLRPSLLLLLALPLLASVLGAWPTRAPDKRVSLLRILFGLQLLLVLWMGLWLHPGLRPVDGGLMPSLAERWAGSNTRTLDLALVLDGLSYPWVLSACLTALGAVLRPNADAHEPSPSRPLGLGAPGLALATALGA